MVIAGYARVSTVEQSQDCSLEQQIDRLKRAGAETVFVDVKSGKTTNRPQLKELLKLVDECQISEVIITRLDRLGRSVIDLLKTIEILEKHKVKLRVLDSPLDLSSPFGRMNLNQISAIAQFESELLSNRIKHGNAYARSLKKSFKAIFGYVRNQEGYLELDQTINEKTGLSNADVAREIVKLLCDQPLRGCCKIIYENYDIKFSPSGLRKWLMHPALRGHTGYYTFQDKPFYHDKDLKPELHHNTHQGLMTEEQFTRINQNLADNRKFCGDSPNKGKYPLAGLVKCGVCGFGMVREFGKSKRRTAFIRCGKHARGGHFCSNRKYTQMGKITSVVLTQITEHSQKIISRAVTSASKPEDSEPAEVTDLRSQLAGLKGLNSQNPAILLAIIDMESQIENAIARAKIQLVPMNQGLTELITKTSHADFWESLDETFLREVFLRLVSRVVVDDLGAVSVELKF